MVFINLLVEVLILAIMNFNATLTGRFSNDKNNIVKKGSGFWPYTRSFVALPVFLRKWEYLSQLGRVISASVVVMMVPPCARSPTRRGVCPAFHAMLSRPEGASASVYGYAISMASDAMRL